MTETEVLVAALADVFRFDGAVIWLFAPNPLLDGETAADVWLRGDHERVLALLQALAEGVVM